MVFIQERVAKLIECVKELMYSDVYSISEYKMLKTTEQYETVRNINTSDWADLRSKDVWGGHREQYYFVTNFRVPEKWREKTLVYELRTGKEGEWDAVNPQFLAYVNEEVKQGMDVNHREFLLTSSAETGKEYQILLSAFTGDNNFSLHLNSEIKVLDLEVEKYYYDLKIPYEVARLLKKDSDEYIEIIRCLNESLNFLDLRKEYSEEFYASLKLAQEYLTKEFYEKRCKNSRQTICCVGHTHIDVAWLWTLKTTRDKVVRSFSTVLELMRHYPEFKFMSSQPQLYKYVKQDAPQVYDEIKKRIGEGRWETEGGMWVEADCNIASGEALIRQFIYGLRFFKNEFNTKNEVLWLPDVFGYSAALPQIMKKCGINYFMTTKISWNEFNKMPYDTFMWEGIDGTAVLTHFIPTRDFDAAAKEGSTETEHFTTYNGILAPPQVKGSWQRYSQKDLNNQVLMAYGYGDGGGGPTKEMLENQRRMEQGIPGCPQTKQSHSREFFADLEKELEGQQIPKWVGELYLEYHRGTYTSMARNKKYNRKSEFAYQNLEFFSSMAKQLLNTKYPKKEIQESWEVILRNQFHDILPGSSIKEVYDDSKEEYEKILGFNEVLTCEILLQISNHVQGKKGDVVIFNPNSAAEKAPVMIPLMLQEKNLVLKSDDDEFPLQPVDGAMVAVIDNMKVKGYKTFTVEKKVPGVSELTISTTEVDTPFFHVKLNEQGQFVSIFDKKCMREIIPGDERANVIITYEDKPHNFDSWDINNYYTEKSWEVDQVSSIEILEEGPVRACLKIKREYLDSVICQYIYFYADLYQIDIRNEIDWKEKQLLVRDFFPLDVHTNEAVYEIQYGNVKRPTHSNTSWDFARFEVCMHKWLDVSENGYGVSILNDCKYGANVNGSTVGLTMLKSAVYPNPEADKGHHTFWYAICPHQGDFRQGKTVSKAYVFNNPYVAMMKEEDGNVLADTYSFVKNCSQNVIIEVVKEAEDNEDTVLRLYECFNKRENVVLEFDKEIDRIYNCDILENIEFPLNFSGNKVCFETKPYEIKTLKIRFQTTGI